MSKIAGIGAARKFRKKWEEAKIRRGTGGRFSEKPDEVKDKPSKVQKKLKEARQYVGSITAQQRDKVMQSVVGKTRGLTEQQKKNFNTAQKLRLQEVIQRKAKEKAAAKAKKAQEEAESAKRLKPLLDAEKPQYSPPASQPEVNAAPKAKAKRSGSSSVKFGSRVVVKVSHDSTYRVEENKNHNYTVEHEGKELSLNKHTRVVHYAGEVTEGVPRLVGTPEKASTEDLAIGLARAERGAKRGTAPTWDTRLHGGLGVDDSLVGKSKGQNIMGMQIHHVDRWSSDPSRVIEADYKAGRITEQERLDRYYKQQVMETQPNAKMQAKLVVPPQGERKFVVLAGGVHQGGTPLYFANHPMFISMETGKFDGNVGLPSTGVGGREWFDKYRGKFWKEYHKGELQNISEEINKRVTRGESIKDIEALYKAEKDRLDGKTT